MFIGGVAKLIGLAGKLIEVGESGDTTWHGMTLHTTALPSEVGPSLMLAIAGVWPWVPRCNVSDVRSPCRFDIPLFIRNRPAIS